MAQKLLRYDITDSYNTRGTGGTMTCYEDGDYMKVSDVIALLKKIYIRAPDEADEITYEAIAELESN
jgi:hypothetical protein